jgi:hypothetical protein
MAGHKRKVQDRVLILGTEVLLDYQVNYIDSTYFVSKGLQMEDTNLIN